MEDLTQPHILPFSTEHTSEVLNNSLFTPRSRWSAFINKLCLLPWKRTEVMEVTLYVSICTVVMAVLGAELDSDNVADDSKRNPLVIMTIVVTPFSTIFGTVLLKARTSMWITVSVFLSMWLGPLAGLVAYLFKEWRDLDIVTVMVLTYIPANVTYFCMLRTIRTSLTRRYNHSIASIVTSAICILAPFIIISGTIYKIALTQHIDRDFLGFLIKAFSAPYLLSLICIWIYIHITFFHKYESTTQELKLKYFGTGIPEMPVQAALKANPLLFESSSPACWKAVQEHAHIMSSGCLLIIMIGIEIGLIVLLNQYVERQHEEEVLWMTVFYIPAVPMFLIFGVMFSASMVKKDDKMGIGTLVGLIAPVMIIMPVSYELSQHSETEVLGMVLAIGYPCGVLYWISLSVMFHHYKRSYQLITSILCLTLVVPIGVLYPFYSIDSMETHTFWIIFSLFCFGGFVVLVLFYIVDFFRNVNRELYIFALKLRYLEWFDISQWIYTASFIVSFSLLVWAFFWTSNNQRSEYGLVSGCFIIIVFLFICSIITHRITLYIKSTFSPEVSIREIIMKKTPKPSTMELELLSKKKKYQKLILIIGIVFPILIIVPTLSATDASDVTVTLAITLAIGSAVVFIVFLLLIELKSFLRQYGKIAINYGLGCCWCFVVLPLVCLIPVTLFYADNAEDLSTISSWSIGFVLFLVMAGVSSVSITLNILFRRMEYEKMAKYCCIKMRSLLKKNAVRSRLDILRLIFDQVYMSGGAIVQDVLLDGTSVYFWPIEESDPDLRFSKELVTIEELHKLEMKAGGMDLFEEEKDYKQEISCWQFILRLCSNKIEDEEVRIIEDLQPEELGKLADNYYRSDFIYPERINTTSQDKNIRENSIDSAINININQEQTQRGPEIQQMPISPVNQYDKIETLRTLFLNESNKNMWTDTIKDIVNRSKKQKRRQMKYLIQTLYRDYPDEDDNEIENIEVKKLNEDRLKKVIESEHFLLLREDTNARNAWYLKVFNRFSHGMIIDEKGPWMTLHDLRQFLRLTGLKSKIPNVSCDLIYVKMSRKFTASRSSKTFTKIRYEEFLNELVRICGRYVYPKLQIKEAENKVFENYIYPYLVTNLPYLGVPDVPKDSPRKQKALMLMGGVMLQNTIGLDIDKTNQKLEKNKEKNTLGNRLANYVESEDKSEDASFEDQLSKVILASDDKGCIRPIEDQPSFQTPQDRVDLDFMPSIDIAINNYLSKKTSQNGDLDVGNVRISRRPTVVYSNNRIQIKDDLPEESSKLPKGCRWLDTLLDNFIKCIGLFLQLITGLLKFLIKICFELCNPIPKAENEYFKQKNDKEKNSESDQSDPEASVKDRKPSPEWPDIAKLITDTFSHLLTEVKELIKHQNSTEMELNTGNLLQILGHFLEVVAFASVAFSEQVGWAEGNSQSSDASEAVLVDNKFWVEIFWSCLGLAVVFASITPSAIYHAKRGTLGLTEDRTKAKFPHPQFFFAKIISLIGKSAYLTIMKAFLNAFSCTYDQDTTNWYVTRNSDLTCFDDSHSMYLGLSVLGVILYYPGATLLYPNIQYQDKSLDLKFDTTYLVLESQGKIIIAGAVAFFAVERYLWLHLIVSIVVLVLLAILCGFMKPCMVRSYNLWKTGGYIGAAWCCSWALINIYSKETMACFIILWVGLVVLLVILLTLQIRLYGCDINKLKHFRSMLKGKDVIEDGESRNNSMVKQ